MAQCQIMFIAVSYTVH